MMKLVSIFGNWLMERFIKEKIPKMAMATNTSAVVTGLLTAVLCRLIRFQDFLFQDFKIEFPFGNGVSVLSEKRRQKQILSFVTLFAAVEKLRLISIPAGNLLFHGDVNPVL